MLMTLPSTKLNKTIMDSLSYYHDRLTLMSFLRQNRLSLPMLSTIVLKLAKLSLVLLLLLWLCLSLCDVSVKMHVG